MNAVITPPWNPTNGSLPRHIKGVRGLTSSLHSFPLTPLHSIPSALLSPRRRGSVAARRRRPIAATAIRWQELAGERSGESPGP
ncbi:hypothetical protein BS78_01G188300 [Paspalum vaginatum]|nr:hypothetical protein BS78_01G188300 [Paspalum vaginatum]